MNDFPSPHAAEGTLRDSDRRYRDLVEGGGRNIVFRLSDSGELTFVNRAFDGSSNRSPRPDRYDGAGEAVERSPLAGMVATAASASVSVDTTARGALGPFMRAIFRR